MIVYAERVTVFDIHQDNTIIPPHFVHYIQPKVGGGLILEYAISLEYKPPFSSFHDLLIMALVMFAIAS